MIIQEKFIENETEYIKTYSDSEVYIKDTDGNIFESAIDLASNEKTYIETEDKIPNENEQSDINKKIQDEVERIINERYPQSQEKTYSKYKFMLFMKQNNMWDAFKNWLSLPDNIEIQDMWDTVLEFGEDDPNFKTFTDLFKTYFKVSDEEIDHMKAICLK